MVVILKKSEYVCLPCSSRLQSALLRFLPGLGMQLQHLRSWNTTLPLVWGYLPSLCLTFRFCFLFFVFLSSLEQSLSPSKFPLLKIFGGWSSSTASRVLASQGSTKVQFPISHMIPQACTLLIETQKLNSSECRDRSNP